jgi:hypothetical protein
VVRKNLKIGNVSLAFSDATIAAGLPITLVRSYDGRAPVDSTLSSRMSPALRCRQLLTEELRNNSRQVF